jgi:hypothetical protein
VYEVVVAQCGDESTQRYTHGVQLCGQGAQLRVLVTLQVSVALQVVASTSPE